MNVRLVARSVTANPPSSHSLSQHISDDTFAMNQTKKTSTDSRAAQRHLQAASDLLLSTSPHASAFIASHLRPAKQPPSQSIPSNCRACGYALIPGWSCTVTKRHRQPPAKKSTTKNKPTVTSAGTTTPTTRIDYECSLCHSINTFNSSTHAPKRHKASKITAENIQKTAPAIKAAVAPVAQVSTGATSTPSPAPSTAVSSSSEQGRGDKKRNRKQKLGGLQAMLAKSKATSTAPQGFDFMDFMKTT